MLMMIFWSENERHEDKRSLRDDENREEVKGGDERERKMMSQQPLSESQENKHEVRKRGIKVEASFERKKKEMESNTSLSLSPQDEDVFMGS